MSVELFLNSVVGFATLTGHCQNHCSSQKCNSFIIQVSFESNQSFIGIISSQDLSERSTSVLPFLYLKTWTTFEELIYLQMIHTFSTYIHAYKIMSSCCWSFRKCFSYFTEGKVQCLSSVRWCQRVQLKFFLSFKESKAFAIQELSLKSNEALPGWIQNTWATCLLQLFNASIMELKTCKVFNHQFIYISTFWYFVIILLKNICNIVEIYHIRPQ